MNPLDFMGAGVAILTVFAVWAVARKVPRAGMQDSSRVLAVVLTVACLGAMVILFLPWATRPGDFGSFGGITVGVFALLLVIAAYWAANQGAGQDTSRLAEPPTGASISSRTELE